MVQFQGYGGQPRVRISASSKTNRTAAQTKPAADASRCNPSRHPQFHEYPHDDGRLGEGDAVGNERQRPAERREAGGYRQYQEREQRGPGNKDGARSLHRARYSVG